MKRLVIFIVLCSVACVQENPAPIIYKGDRVYDRDYYKNNKYDTGAAYRTAPDGRTVRDLRKSTNNNTLVASTEEPINLNEPIRNEVRTVPVIAKTPSSNNENIIVPKEYIVKEGETLYGIAVKFGVPSKDIIVLNNLKEPYNIYIGQKLKMPTDDKSNIAPREYIVKEGETLYGIAIRFDISSKDIIALNNLQEPYKIYIGQKLKMPVQKIQYHYVEEGENLSSIARKYDVNITSLVELNNLKVPYIIYPKQQLRLPSSMSGYSISKVVSEGDKADAKTTTLSKTTTSTTPTKVINVVKDKDNKFSWPVIGSIVSKFGPKDGGLYNDGINIKASEGTAFKSTEDGVVAYVGNELRGYGNLVIVKHSDNWISAYGHCQSIKVARGDKVNKGDILGYVGKTGNVKEPQLYFGLRKGRQAVNPEKYLK